MDENKDEIIQEENISEEDRYNIPEDIYIYNEPKKEKKRWSFRGSVISYIALALVASIIGGLASTYIAPNLVGTILPNPKTMQYEARQVNITTNDDINTVSAVAKKAVSSVVGITTVEVQEYLFSQREVPGTGSGVIVDSNGYILTNSHVIAGGNARSIVVLFENGEKLPANVIYNDNDLDMAIIKVDATGLPVATLGDSDSLEVGEIAIAIGNPLGLEFQRTVTSGIISGLNRSIQFDNNNIISNLIQTDASINPGNSGGPLLNRKGEVIGINTAKIKSAEGLGFTIPINDIKLVIENIVKNGTSKSVFMGISGVTIDEYQTKLGIDLEVKQGVILIKVEENTPASRAGLMYGDIITKIDDEEIKDISQLKRTLYKYKKGDKATITLIRNNTETLIDIEFTEIR